MADLHTVDADDKIAVSASTSVPHITNIPSAIGAMYVMEGSTLGGTIIAGMLAKHAGIESKALQFFNGYGDNNKTMWDTFTNAMNKLSPEMEKEVIETANITFQQFGRWIDVVYNKEKVDV